ncbi:hypothetical protein RRG08_061224 [Elysia crispata]|uniref:Uncharacterized protein n=1 Tax=Elysia crispata TaxID=231223 RepID=A0AAE1DGA6_9GAST|nr:hypothetical protein RRG08_061224 [Elysia crispata]
MGDFVCKQKLHARQQISLNIGDQLHSTTVIWIRAPDYVALKATIPGSQLPSSSNSELNNSHQDVWVHLSQYLRSGWILQKCNKCRKQALDSRWLGRGDQAMEPSGSQLH